MASGGVILLSRTFSLVEVAINLDVPKLGLSAETVVADSTDESLFGCAAHFR